MKQNIYADNAATTKMDKDALSAMIPYFNEEYGNASQPYSFSRNSKKALSESRTAIAKCINALPEEIYFTSGGTESDNWALNGFASFMSKDEGIITSKIEHHAILNPCKELQKKGYIVKYTTPNSVGIVDVEKFRKEVDRDTKLASIMYVNNELGTIQPIKELCSIAHDNGAIFHTDAVQAVGHIPIDVRDLGIDMMSASAHKFNGPKGIGFMYIKKGINIAPCIIGGAQEAGLRAGTENIPSIVGMTVALQKNCQHISENMTYVNTLAEKLLNELSKAGVEFHRNGSNTVRGIISLSFKGLEGEALLHRLDLMGIAVSTGSACDSKRTNISHVLEAIKLDDEWAKGTIRISLGKDNTEREIIKIAQSITKCVK